MKRQKKLKLERQTIVQLTPRLLPMIRGGGDAGENVDFLGTTICDTSILRSRLTCSD